MADSLKKIAIIGGGLTGPILALCLKKCGISSTIYELHDTSYIEGGPIVLNPNACRVLDHLNVHSALLPYAYSGEKVGMYNSSGSKLGTLYVGNKKLFQYASIRLLRPHLRAALLKECTAQGIEIFVGKKLVSIEEQDDGVHLEFSDSTRETASLVIGCDGSYSTIRKVIEPTAKTEYSGLHVIYGSMPRDKFVKLVAGQKRTFQDPSILVGQEGSLVLIPMDHDATQVAYFFSTALPDQGKEGWAELGKDKEALRALLIERYCKGTWGKDVEILIKETNADTFLSWATSKLEELKSWSSPSGRIVLAGDSAHVMPPAAGQGGAMGFEDAETLAFVLASVNTQAKGKAELKASLQKWEKHRKERIRAIVAFTNLAMKLRTPSPNWLLQWFKEWVISVILFFKGPAAETWLYGYDGTSEVVRKAML